MSFHPSMIPAHKGEIPAVTLFVPFALGIVAALNLFPDRDINLVLIAFLITSLVFIILNIAYRRLHLYKYQWVGGALMHLLLFLFGCISAINHREVNQKDHFSKAKAQYLGIRIGNEPVLKNGFLRFTANVEAAIDSSKKLPVGGTLMVMLKDTSAKNLYYGDELLIPAKYSPVDPPFNPAEFNYKAYLAGKNIYYQEFLYPKQYAVVDQGNGNPLIYHSLRLRQQLIAKLKTNVRDTTALEVVSSLLLGYRAGLSEDVRDTYARTGALYVLSVSGSQVAIIYLLLSFALSFLERRKYGKLVRAVIIIAVLWYYALLTGFSMSVCRASLMVSLVVIGKTFSRYINSLNILAIAAFLLLIYDPFSIAEPGFQLSFIAVSGLILFQPMVYRWFRFKNKWADKLWALCSLSIAAQLIILPLCAFYFHQLPIYFLLSNLLIIVPAAVLMYTGILYLLLPQIPVISVSLAFILEKTAFVMTNGLALINRLPIGSINKVWITMPECLLLFIGILGLFFFSHYKKSWQLILCLSACLLLCSSVSIKRINQANTKSIAWLNLKKHTGIVFKNGNEAIVLSDLKQTDRDYLYSIQPYLDSCQVNQTMVYNPGQGISSPWLKKRYGLVSFLCTPVFIFNGTLQQNALVPKPQFSYLYLTGNPDVGLDVLASNFNYQNLIIDGTNSDKSIENWQKQLPKNIYCKILKRNKSFVWVSN